MNIVKRMRFKKLVILKTVFTTEIKSTMFLESKGYGGAYCLQNDANIQLDYKGTLKYYGRFTSLEEKRRVQL